MWYRLLLPPLSNQSCPSAAAHCRVFPPKVFRVEYAVVPRRARQCARMPTLPYLAPARPARFPTANCCE
ncbi:hypothetical protein COEREDRAFT_80463 [Coemansia reversa NRRL 1564]|uniref:Uncharacterized protein n=1 Tax=Coemansia reversa (strain ATCC 12441 / NRRL 1564) TaxID=763665 RepID=A0A2G5BEN4_COERN|nr:hypothetical protein COEREDRAFT_80463 [Coemansia reversa NRRL 1564]|eukprot:PIA17452.1 hypothetical protein COEREDRAFT_80463 [Coemansia reversa NRRL 1564]